MPASLRRQRPSLGVVSLATVYVILLALATWKHIFWRDESEAWIVARTSTGLLSLLHNTRYEGHPPLWYFILFCFSRITWNPEWMKLPNALFALGAAFLVLSRRNLSLLLRGGLVFSYFLLFEYPVIDRNYMAGVFLLIAAAILDQKPEQHRSRTFGVAVLLSLAAITSLPALIVSVCLYLFHLYRTVPFERPGALLAPLRRPTTPRIAGLVLFTASSLFSLAMIRPPADSGLMIGQDPWPGAKAAIVNAGDSLADAYLPLPVCTYKFWDTTWGGHYPNRATGFGWLLFLALAVSLRDRRSQSFFLGSSGLLLAQLTISGRTFPRQVGWLFIALLLTLLLEPAEPSRPTRAGLSLRTIALGSILTLQVAVGLAVLAISLRRPFSSSKQLAASLRQQHLDQLPMIFFPDYVGQSVMAYLQKPTAFYLEREAEASIIVWDRTEYYHAHTPAPQDLVAASKDGTRPLLITQDPLTPEQLQSLHVAQVAAYTDAICEHDQYFVYR